MKPKPIILYFKECMREAMQVVSNVFRVLGLRVLGFRRINCLRAKAVNPKP